MSNPEMTPGAEFALDPQIRKLFEDASTWLLAHGHHTTSDEDATGYIDDLAIQLDPETYNAQINGHVMHSRLPRVATYFGVGERIDLIFLTGRTSNDGEIESDIAKPELVISIDTAPETQIENVRIFIKQTPQGYTANRAESPTTDGHENDIQAMQEHNKFLEQMGLDILTQEECAMLQSVVDSLDILVREQ